MTEKPIRILSLDGGGERGTERLHKYVSTVKNNNSSPCSVA